MASPVELRTVGDDAKVCTKCGIVKPFCEFNKRGGKKSGHCLRSDCKQCQGKRRAAYFDKNRVAEMAQTMAWYAKHPERAKELDAAYRDRNREKIRAQQKVRHERTKDIVRKYILKKKYGITVADYQRLLVLQGGRCAICRSDKPGGRGLRFYVDHDHVTGKTRGLLCIRCNTGIGGLRDNVLILRAAIAYLENPPWR